MIFLLERMSRYIFFHGPVQKSLLISAVQPLSVILSRSSRILPIYKPGLQRCFEQTLKKTIVFPYMLEKLEKCEEKF
jgi:hypothetical protein